MKILSPFSLKVSVVNAAPVGFVDSIYPTLAGDHRSLTGSEGPSPSHAVWRSALEGDPPSLVWGHAQDPARPAECPFPLQSETQAKEPEREGGLDSLGDACRWPPPRSLLRGLQTQTPGEPQETRGREEARTGRERSGEPRPGPALSLSHLGTHWHVAAPEAELPPPPLPAGQRGQARGSGPRVAASPSGSVSSAVDGSGVTPEAVRVTGWAGVEQRRAGTQPVSPASSAGARDQEQVVSVLPASRVGRCLLDAEHEMPRAGRVGTWGARHAPATRCHSHHGARWLTQLPDAKQDAAVRKGTRARGVEAKRFFQHRIKYATCI